MGSLVCALLHVCVARLSLWSDIQMVMAGQWGIERSISLADQSQGQVAMVAMFKVHGELKGIAVWLRWPLISSPLRPRLQWDFKGRPIILLPFSPLSGSTIELSEERTTAWMQHHGHRSHYQFGAAHKCAIKAYIKKLPEQTRQKQEVNV